MRLGFMLPQYGAWVGPEDVLAVARRAEELGYDTLWVSERLMKPVAPAEPYPASADGKLPEGASSVLDAIETLTFVAAVTTRIGLGTSVVNLPYQSPFLLARRLATLDVLSRGRLRVGLGNAWSTDELVAVGAPLRERGARSEEAIAVLKAVWGPDPVAFEGRHFRVPAAQVGPKPVQRPHPPIYLAAYTPATMQRVARVADGWNPAGLPIEAMRAMWDGIRAMAREAGRDPAALELVVRANLAVTPQPLGRDRPAFVGSIAEIAGDAAAARELGAAEVAFDAQLGASGASTAALLERMEELRAAVG